MYENLHYESVYFKELHNEQKTIDRQYSERGQLWCQLLLVNKNEEVSHSKQENNKRHFRTPLPQSLCFPQYIALNSG